MYDGEISGNKAIHGSTTSSGFGGGVLNAYGNVVMAGGEISGNTANFGGGVFNYESSTYKMSGNSVIAHNIATLGQHSGGGVYNYGDFTMLDNALISDNTAPFGGGVFNEAGTFTMKSGAISGNTATKGNGGGIYANNVYDPNAKIFIDGGTISDNTTPMNGGGIYVARAHFNKLAVAAGVVFSNNKAATMYDRDPADDAVYYAQIDTDVTWTTPFTQGYNNYDIFYIYGTQLEIYEITYNSNTGTGFMGNTLVFYDTVVTLVSNGFSKDGYVFVGWNTFADGAGDSFVDGATFTYTLAEDLTLYAQWVLVSSPVVEEFMVFYDGNGATGGSVPVDAGVYEYGAIVFVADNSGVLFEWVILFLVGHISMVLRLLILLLLMIRLCLVVLRFMMM
jgi:uncharacterized repeat protein (TIGR02543 family)